MAALEQVHRGDAARPALIFVHGLGGHPFDTWVGPGTSRDDCWLHWVGKDTRCDTWTLDYDAALSRWQGQALPLPDQGTQVAHLLAVHPGLADRAIALIGHSMGGLVIKTLLTQTQASGDAAARALVARIRGVVFIATPHQGSQLASLADAVAVALRTNPQVGDMRLHDAHLRRLGTEFRAQRQALNLPVAVFAEGRDVVLQHKRMFGLLTRQVGVRIVDPSSSDPALEGVTAVVLPEDHFSICKPSVHDAQILLGLVDFVAGLLQPQPQPVAAVQHVASSAVAPLQVRQPDSPLAGPQDSRLQPADGCFFGRDDEVQQVLDFLRGAGGGLVVTAREVSGAGGIGKTEVCKAALRRWLAERPGEQVWLVPVADGAGLPGLVTRLAGMLNRPDVQSAEQLLQALPAGLFYLDNLESVAASPEGVTFLRAMQQLPGVRLLVSSRYSAPRVFGSAIEIGVLPRDAALRLFRTLWLGREALPADEVLAGFVVDDLGRHALSVVLAARLGDCHAYADLMARWRALGAGSLQQHGDDSRHGSLSACLRLTAQALDRTPGALDLWTVLALFSTGASEDDLAELEQRGNWPQARPALVRHHVIQRQADGRWTMLPPLARYALGASLDQADGIGWAGARDPVRAMFKARAASADSIQSTPEALASRAWLIAHFETLARLLDHEMRVSPPDVAWLQGVHDQLVDHYQFQVALSLDLLRQFGDLLPLPGSALKLLGDLESRLGRVDVARALYDRALAQFDRAQAGLGQANTLLALGDLECRLSRLLEARVLYDRALAQFERAQAGHGQANTLKSLGDLEKRLGRMEEARALYDRALAQYEREQDDLGQANTLQALGDLERRLGRVHEARALYDRALAQYEREQAGLGQANTLQALGDLERRLGRLDEARALYDRALAQYEREQDGLGQANTLQALGDLESRLGRLDVAKALYDRALAQFELKQAGLGQANTLKALGDLQRRLGQVDEARALYDRALALSEREQDSLGQANTLQALGDLTLGTGDFEAAAPVYQRALSLYASAQEPMGLAYTFAELARCLHSMRREAESHQSLQQALDFASRTGTDSVRDYVLGSVEDVMGGPDAAQAWLARHAPPAPPPSA